MTVLAAAIRVSTPIMFASLGETLTERSGVLNLGLEGLMLMSAVTAFGIADLSGNLWLGTISGVAVAALIGLLFAFFVVSLKLDQVVVGLSLTLLGTGLSAYLFRITFGASSVPPSVVAFQPINFSFLAEIPVIGPILFQHLALTYVALLLIPVIYLFLFKTSVGLKIIATGEDPKAAESVGIKVDRLRYTWTLVGSCLAGLGGAFLPIGYSNTFLPGMTAGRGWIAIALVVFGSWNPLRVALGTFIFGIAEGLQLRLQLLGFGIPYQFPLMLPYVLTIVVLVITRRARGPAALGTPYRKE